MNERIKELAFQAAEDCVFEQAKPSIVVEGEGGIYKMEIPNVFVEKFAEQIVRECVEYYRSQIGETSEPHTKTLEHFGVEE